MSDLSYLDLDMLFLYGAVSIHDIDCRTIQYSVASTGLPVLFRW